MPASKSEREPDVLASGVPEAAASPVGERHVQLVPVGPEP
jgi:hypothetical protein